ncbi:asparaginase [Proteinivorax hydrogeniformans]|uniref:Asparaginase n=1 Tax=Proteinivorax hydrogeniformans TaxID=1826727 RepID=A0AAU8HTM5_9FIRM
MGNRNVLVQVTRGTIVESQHRGNIAVVNSKGQLEYSVGDPQMVSYWRSSAKPVQAIPIVASGAMDEYGITKRELALFCSSHSGEEIHTEGVFSVLEKLRLTEEKLDCGSHPPLHKESALKLQDAKKDATKVHCNCSGKHSGMLVLCKKRDYDIASDDYTSLKHPLQQELLQVAAEFCKYPKEDIAIGIDGCGVPVYGMPIYNWALAYSYLADPKANDTVEENVIQTIADAMVEHPDMVGGTERFCTDLMRVGKGNLVAKAGAEGVYCVGIRDQKRGIAVKMEDGMPRGRQAAVVETLKQLGALDEEQLKELKDYHIKENKNHRDDVVGLIKPTFNLEKSDSL